MTIDPDDLIPSAETAALLRVKENTLTSWRNQRRGPTFFKIGRAVFYRRADLSDWLASQRRIVTARNPATATV
jgi:Helix-turn-helix domain